MFGGWIVNKLVDLDDFHGDTELLHRRTPSLPPKHSRFTDFTVVFCRNEVPSSQPCASTGFGEGDRGKPSLRKSCDQNSNGYHITGFLDHFTAVPYVFIFSVLLGGFWGFWGAHSQRWLKQYLGCILFPVTPGCRPTRPFHL